MSIRVSGPRQYWLASAFVLLAIGCVAALLLMAGGWLQVDSEALGLAVGALLIVLLWIGIRRD